MPAKSGAKAGELEFMDAWYPIQVKQKDKAGRPEIDSFEAAMLKFNRTIGFFVAFDFTQDARDEIRAFNQRLSKDSRVRISLVPIGDGMTLALKLRS